MDKIKIIKNRIIDENFFRPRWFSVFINPYFINRKSLHNKISLFAVSNCKNKKVLDVGCGIKPYRSLFETKDYIGIDIQGGGHTDQAKTVDKFYDGLNIPYEDSAFDIVICTQVLEHAIEPESLVKEISRVTKPGGKIFISMPFTYPEHEKPFDFRRFTSFQHQRILNASGFQNIIIQQTTGFFGTFGQLLVISMFEGIKIKATILKTVLTIFVFAPIQIFSILLDLITNKSGMAMDYVVTAEKK